MWTVAERADAFFMNKSPIHETMRRLRDAMADLEIPFAIAGAMAANRHGHRRTTADVDILIVEEDLRRFKDAKIGLGYLNKFEGSKNFRDAVTGVNIDALLSGGYPGDGLPKPIVFPDPGEIELAVDEGLPYISLPTLMELKLASGMTSPQRPRDFDDAIQLIRINQLPKEFGGQLNDYVVPKFEELWGYAQMEEDY